MATTTPNFGWAVPTSSDLVKNGATAIETLGDSIDASMVDLKGGTTDQVLAKNSNTDMDFKWVTSGGGGFTYATYTPTFTNFTKGNATIVARWAQSGKAVNVFVQVTLGNTSSVTGSIITSLPVTAASNAVGSRGVGGILDSGVRVFTATTEVLSTTTVELHPVYAALNNASEEYTSSTIPMTWTTNDGFVMNFIYEAA